MTSPDAQARLKACRECGAECRVEVFPSTELLGTPATIWMCSKHKFFGGDCPSDTAYLTEDAWNDTRASLHR